MPKKCGSDACNISKAVMGNCGKLDRCAKKGALPQIDPLVPAPMQQDYIEAWTILEDSPRMSSVLSRRILRIFKKYAGKTQYGLAKQIDAFIEDSRLSSRIRENLHYLREIGDFSARTRQEQTQPEEARPVINVTPEEAQWTLKVIGDLFDHFIVGSEKAKQLRASFDKKIEAAGRKPINLNQHL